MKHIKTPIRREAYYLEESNGKALAQVFYGATDADLRTAPQAINAAREIERAVNFFDALLAACKEAYELMDDRTNTFPEPCDDVVMLSTMITLKTAIEKAEVAQ